MKYVVGWNMPGYLPDSEPSEFDDFESAKTYLLDTLKDGLEYESDEFLTDSEIDQEDADNWKWTIEDISNLKQADVPAEWYLPDGYCYFLDFVE